MCSSPLWVGLKADGDLAAGFRTPLKLIREEPQAFANHLCLGQVASLGDLFLFVIVQRALAELAASARPEPTPPMQIFSA